MDGFGDAMQFLAVPLLMLHRLAMREYVHRSMFAASGARNPNPPPERRPPQVTAVAAARIDVSGPTSHAEWEAHREALAACKRRPLNFRALAGLLAAVLYLGVPPLLAWIGGAPDPALWKKLAGVAWMQLVLTGISYWLNRREFRPRDHTLTASWPQARMLKIALRALAQPPWDALLWLLIAVGAFEAVVGQASPFSLQTYRDAAPPGAAIGVALAVVLHGALVVGGWFIRDRSANPKLLVLRVFGPSTASTLVFDRLADTWSLYGTYLTIDDPEFAKHRYRFWQISTLITWLVASLFGYGSLWLSLAFIAVVAASDWHGLLTRGPARNLAAARRRVDRVLARPWTLGGSFADVRTVAYMDLWKGVIEIFVKAADVVVFDLRGYNDERGGSAWEVGYLFDTLAMNRVVFLHNPADTPAVQALLQRTSCTLCQASPNQAFEQATIQIVLVQDDDAAGAGALMDRLLWAAANCAR